MRIEEMQEALDELEKDLPQEILKELNGGIILAEDSKMHPQSMGNDLFILGEYHHEPRGLGRYVMIYYGSIMRTHGHLSREKQLDKLKAVLYHELFHHLESQAGERSLEVQDAIDLARYKGRYKDRYAGK